MKARLMILSAFAALPMLASAAAFTPAELDKAVASLPKANVMGGFAVHSKQFCGSCHGPNGIAPTEMCIRDRPSLRRSLVKSPKSTT